MTWFKVDDQAAFGPKIVHAGNAAVGAWLRAGSWSAAQLTDGFIPLSVAHTIAPRKIWLKLAEPVGRSSHGLIELRDDGYQIHDYLEYNDSAFDVRTRRAHWASRKVKARPHVNDSNGLGEMSHGDTMRESTEESDVDSRRESSLPDPDPDPDQDLGSAVAAPHQGTPEAIPDAAPTMGVETTDCSHQEGPRTNRSAENGPKVDPVPQAAKEGPRRPKRKSETDCPSSEATGDEVKAWLSTWKITGDEAEVAHWMDHHRSRGNRFRDWSAAWRTWQRNGVRFGRTPPPTPPQSPPKKPVEVAQVGMWMDNLRNAKPGEHVR